MPSSPCLTPNFFVPSIFDILQLGSQETAESAKTSDTSSVDFTIVASVSPGPKREHIPVMSRLRLPFSADSASIVHMIGTKKEAFEMQK